MNLYLNFGYLLYFQAYEELSKFLENVKDESDEYANSHGMLQTLRANLKSWKVLTEEGDSDDEAGSE